MTDPAFESRLPLWTALAEIFLDTELQDTDYVRIAAVLASSGLSPDALRAILEEEVAPAFAFNLFDIAGEWTPWSEDEVRQIMSVSRSRSFSSWVGKRARRKYLAAEWQKIAAHLPLRD